MFYIVGHDWNPTHFRKAAETGRGTYPQKFRLRQLEYGFKFSQWDQSPYEDSLQFLFNPSNIFHTLQILKVNEKIFLQIVKVHRRIQMRL